MSYNRDRYSSTMFMPQRAPVRYMLTCVTIAAVLVVVRALIADAGAIGGPRVTANSSHAIEAMASTPATMTVATLYAGLTHY
jgi:hypothetical protein